MVTKEVREAIQRAKDHSNLPAELESIRKAMGITRTDFLAFTHLSPREFNAFKRAKICA